MAISNNHPIFEEWRFSGTCLVSADRNRTSVPAEWTGKVVPVSLGAHSIKVVAGGGRVARHEHQVRAQAADPRAPVCEEPWHYLTILETRRGALRHRLPFTAWVLPPAVDAVRAHA